MELAKDVAGANERDDDEIRADGALRQFGVRIVRVAGHLELRGDLPRVQDAYLDPPSRSLISRQIADEIVKFQVGLGEQISACLQDLGCDVPIDGATIHTEGVTGGQLNECVERVYARYRDVS